MFKSIPQLETKATRLLHGYRAFAEGTAADVLTARRTETPFVGDVQGLSLMVEGYGRYAREIQADPDFGTLSQDLRDDVTAIAEESEIAAAEIFDLCDPDAVWEKAEREVKQNAANRFRHRPEDTDLIRARLRHEIREQNGGQAVRVVPERPKKNAPVIDVTTEQG